LDDAYLLSALLGALLVSSKMKFIKRMCGTKIFFAKDSILTDLKSFAA
jgi:hypothetical protein